MISLRGQKVLQKPNGLGTVKSSIPFMEKTMLRVSHTKCKKCRKIGHVSQFQTPEYECLDVRACKERQKVIHSASKH
jgi:hypothetical protein